MILISKFEEHIQSHILPNDKKNQNIYKQIKKEIPLNKKNAICKVIGDNFEETGFFCKINLMSKIIKGLYY